MEASVTVTGSSSVQTGFRAPPGQPRRTSILLPTKGAHAHRASREWLPCSPWSTHQAPCCILMSGGFESFYCCSSVFYVSTDPDD